MLKRPITYEDFNGDTKTEDFYFNISKSELVELKATFRGGLEESIKRMIEAKNESGLLAEFKRIILLSYGVKSEDGKRFVKSDQLREEFSQTAAYDALFTELVTNENSAEAFIKGVIPRDLVGNDVPQDKPVGPPPLPPSR
jgi:hypothetical protein